MINLNPPIIPAYIVYTAFSTGDHVDHDEYRGTAYDDTIELWGNDPGRPNGPEFWMYGGNDYVGGTSFGDFVHAGDGNDTIYGYGGNDILEGEAGNDTLNGGTGVDVLNGGSGDDTYYVDHGADLVVEESWGGIDTVYSSVDLVMPLYVEKAILTDAAWYVQGNGLNNTITGNAIGNYLNGMSGDDAIFGLEGYDTISGGFGNDTLYGGTGRDTLYGDDGHDTLFGGADIDSLWGGTGDDTYYVDATDVVHEAAGQGNDRVVASESVVLADNVEVLTLQDSSLMGNLLGAITGNPVPSVHFNGTGNSLDNTINGNSGNNVLWGMGGNDVLIGGNGIDQLDGGTGLDRLYGGEGDDVYLVNDGDWVSENANSGFDRVDSTVLSYTLASNVEALRLIENSAAVEGWGNELSNLIEGNTSDNVMYGQGGMDFLFGGAGHDYLEGGDGNDGLYGQSGDDWLAGGAGDDLLEGHDGADFLRGDAGADTLYGGDGDDTYYIDDWFDQVIEQAYSYSSTGNDHVIVRVNDYHLAAGVERLTLTGDAQAGYGNDLDNEIRVVALNYPASTVYGEGGNDQIIGGVEPNQFFGGAGNDSLSSAQGEDYLDGGAGNDILDGGADHDLLLGGAGDDLYRIDGLDYIEELAGDGTDTVEIDASYSLKANFENLSLTGIASINGTGNSLNNVIQGNAGDNSLSGGAGSDILNGNDGNDFVFGEDGDDQLSGGAGNDYLEGGLGSDTLRGGDGNDWVYGNLGADVLIGNAGNDIYMVNDATDVVIEGVNEGQDCIYTTVDFTLPDNVEGFVLDTSKGITGIGNALGNGMIGNASADTLYGRDGADTLWGNGGNDRLYGEFGNDVLNGHAGNDTLDGGQGADSMTGGDGDDVFVVDHTGDLVIELGTIGGGIDTVQSAISYTLGANIENLSLNGTLNISATGNALANVLKGNAGANVLNGGDGNDILDGGAGEDRYIGGLGQDSFYFSGTDVAVAAAGVYQGGLGGERSVDASGDKLIFRAGQILDLTNLPSDRITGIEQVDLTGTGNNTFLFTAADVVALSDTDDLRVDGNAGDIANSVGQGWRFLGNVSIGSNIYEHYLNGQSDLYVDTDVGGTIS